jgi:hypothetical protein
VNAVADADADDGEALHRTTPTPTGAKTEATANVSVAFLATERDSRSDQPGAGTEVGFPQKCIAARPHWKSCERKAARVRRRLVGCGKSTLASAAPLRNCVSARLRNWQRAPTTSSVRVAQPCIQSARQCSMLSRALGAIEPNDLAHPVRSWSESCGCSQSSAQLRNRQRQRPRPRLRQRAADPFHYSGRSPNQSASAAAAIVRSMSASSCARERNAASNCDAGQ